MRLLAIDPGTTQSAAVVWNGEKIDYKAILPNEELLREMDTIFAAWGAWSPGDYGIHGINMAIEMVAHYGTGMPAGKTVFETAVWIGRFVERWCGEPLIIYRREVKLHLCGNVRAKDTNIRQALIDRYGPPGTKKNPGLTYGLKKDLWQAFGVAVTAWETKLHVPCPGCKGNPQIMACETCNNRRQLPKEVA